MSENILETLLSGRLADPNGGPPLCVPTRAVAISDSLAGREAELVAGLDFGPRLAPVSDVNTHETLGARVARALAGKVDLTQIRMTGRPHADAATVAAIRRQSTACDALVAVGSSTINDLCKYAAARDGKEYAVFATAPSMNGYTSLNASITLGGHKKSLPAVAEDLHWPRPFYRDAVRHARAMRNRYTFLDLAADSGLLDHAEIL